MTPIRLYNSATRRKEDFVPLRPDDVRMYVCGPTVYDRAHLGNARPVVVFDVLFRLLRHVYGADHVTYVRNFTDVDDKINARAREMQAAGDGRDMNAIIRALTDETIAWYHADMDALGALRPTQEPRATEWIGAMIGMTETLIARGHAYAAESHVLFDVRSYPAYGRLSGRSVDDMIAGSRVEVAPFKRDPMDFVLWKPSTPEEPGWDSPWGRGRPGWHIECSAMARELLGESFDIHGGGLDLQFPHHENEIAQSCCAHPEGSFARFWLHNEMVQVEGKKMSKSLGNFFTVRDLLELGWAGEVIRMVFLGTHYRKPMDWTVERANDASIALRRWRLALSGVEAGSPHPRILNALSGDLNTALAVTELHALFARWQALKGGVVDHLEEYAGSRDEQLEAVEASFVASANLLGLLLPELGGWESQEFVDEPKEEIAGMVSPRIISKAIVGVSLRGEVNSILRVRAAAKELKKYVIADEIRMALQKMGVIVRDDPTNNRIEWDIEHYSSRVDPVELRHLRVEQLALLMPDADRTRDQ